MAAEEFVAKVASKLSQGEARIWGEIPELVRGGHTFDTLSKDSDPVLVSDVYVVVGGAFRSNADYQVVPSDTHRGNYDYVHRLSCYHLQPPTFQRVSQEAIIKLLSNCITHHDSKYSFSLTKTANAIKVTSCINGHNRSDWVLRFIPAIAGAGNLPEEIDTPAEDFTDPKWLLIPVLKARPRDRTVWNITYLPLAVQMIEKAPILHRAMLCTAYEAANQDWAYGTVNGNHLLTHTAAPMSRQNLSSSLSDQVKALLIELKGNLDEGRVTECFQPHCKALTEISKSEITVLMNDVNQFLNDTDLLFRISTAEDIINKRYPKLLQAAENQRHSFSGTRFYQRRDIVSSEIPNEVEDWPDYSFKELSPIKEDVEDSFVQSAQSLESFQKPITSKDIATEELIQRKVTNGMLLNDKMDINGNCKGYSNGKTNATEAEEQPRNYIWRSIGILSISLVIFVVAGAFLLYFFQEKDFKEFLSDFSSFNKSEL